MFCAQDSVAAAICLTWLNGCNIALTNGLPAKLPRNAQMAGSTDRTATFEDDGKWQERTVDDQDNRRRVDLRWSHRKPSCALGVITTECKRMSLIYQLMNASV